MNRILHITSPEAWQASQDTGAYTAPSLESEGFIHFSTVEQVADTANRYYQGQSGLILLHIDIDRLDADVKWEPSNGILFPHIYGPLNVDAVIQVEDFPCGVDGRFAYPLGN